MLLPLPPPPPCNPSHASIPACEHSRPLTHRRHALAARAADGHRRYTLAGIPTPIALQNHHTRARQSTSPTAPQVPIQHPQAPYTFNPSFSPRSALKKNASRLPPPPPLRPRRPSAARSSRRRRLHRVVRPVQLLLLRTSHTLPSMCFRNSMRRYLKAARRLCP